MPRRERDLHRGVMADSIVSNPVVATTFLVFLMCFLVQSNLMTEPDDMVYFVLTISLATVVAMTACRSSLFFNFDGANPSIRIIIDGIMGNLPGYENTYSRRMHGNHIH